MTCWLSDDTYDRLRVFAAHRGVKLGVPVEEALKAFLAGFYVVDPTAAPQLGVVGAAGESKEGAA